MTKSSKRFIPILILFVNHAFGQKVVKIDAKDGIHYISTTIDHPITGTYFFEGDKEPLVQLNPDGSGIFQFHDLSKTNMVWGMECLENGTPKCKKGFNYAVYSLWYKSKAENTEGGIDGEWTYEHFSIHFQKKKIYISGERSKAYTEQSEELPN